MRLAEVQNDKDEWKKKFKVEHKIKYQNKN